MNLFRRGDLPEEPPAGWDQLGFHPSYRVKRYPTVAELDAEVVRRGLGATREYNDRLARGAVDPKAFEVLLPAQGVFDPELEREIERHEGPHTWGLVHDKNGRRWLTRDGQIAKPLTDRDVQRMRMQAAMEKGRNVFAQAPPPPAPSNIFKRG